jgi:CcmD family protein
VNNPLFLVAGYGITFLTILAYLLHLRRQEKDVDRE